MQNRLYWLTLIFAIFTLGLLARLVDLTILSSVFLRHQGNARTIRTVAITAHRGMILDRNEAPLAISAPVDAVWINPVELDPAQKLDQVIHLLHLPKSLVNKKIKVARDEGREFLYLKRGVDPSITRTIKSLKIPGIYFQTEYRRYYPEGEVTAHVLGFTDVDDHGQEGLELAYNAWLEGKSGFKRVTQDRLGHVVADMGIIHQPQPGRNLVLSIDRRIQYIAFRELKAGVKKFQATSGSVVIVKVKTGEVLGMVNWPSYNPNDRGVATHKDYYRNRVATDLFEPGSTIKSFSMATALASGKFVPSSRINTSPGWMIVNKRRIRDTHDNGILDLAGILKISSNVGMSKVALSLPPQSLWLMLHNLGFGEATHSNFPGERLGVLKSFKTWDTFKFATISFGYALSVTALQLAQAYSVLAAEGVKHPLVLLKTDEAIANQRVMSKKVAQEILVMLESVLAQGGTAPLARVAGYRVAGKTGTTRLVGRYGYEHHRYDSLFAGIAPVSDPCLAIVVILHDPKGKQYYGGYTSGIIFSHIMNDSLRLLNIPPDNPTSK